MTPRLARRSTVLVETRSSSASSARVNRGRSETCVVTRRRLGRRGDAPPTSSLWRGRGRRSLRLSRRALPFELPSYDVERQGQVVLGSTVECRRWESNPHEVSLTGF